MQKLHEYIFETLSKNAKKRLQYLLSNDKLTDEDVDKLYKEKNNDEDHYNSWHIDEDEFEKILTEKGLGNNSFSSDVELCKPLIKMFDKAKKSAAIKGIMKDHGFCSFDDFKKDANSKKKNIYDFCKDWEDVAKKIAGIDYYKSKGGATIGKFEILMRLIISNVDKQEKGDVHCNPDIPIEVKASMKTKTGTNKSGARVNGQTGISDPKVMYKTLFGLIKDTDTVAPTRAGDKDNIYGYKNYFQSESTVKDLVDLINAYTDGNDDFIAKIDEIDEVVKESSFFYKLVSSVFAQYDDYAKDKDIDEIAKIISAANYDENGTCKDFITGKPGNFNIDKKKIFVIVGAIQLYLYQKYEEFKYITIFDQTSGDYMIFDADDIKSIIPIITHCSFMPISTASARAKTCKIVLR